MPWTSPDVRLPRGRAPRSWARARSRRSSEGLRPRRARGGDPASAFALDGGHARSSSCVGSRNQSVLQMRWSRQPQPRAPPAGCGRGRAPSGSSGRSPRRTRCRAGSAPGARDRPPRGRCGSRRRRPGVDPMPQLRGGASATAPSNAESGSRPVGASIEHARLAYRRYVLKAATPRASARRGRCRRRGGGEHLAPPPGARDQHVQPPLAALAVQRPEVHRHRAVLVPPVADGDEDDVALVALDVLEVLDEERLGRAVRRRTPELGSCLGEQLELVPDVLLLRRLNVATTSERSGVACACAITASATARASPGSCAARPGRSAPRGGGGRRGRPRPARRRGSGR